ncbi:hypothetical protein [Azospirillum argentinense]
MEKYVYLGLVERRALLRAERARIDAELEYLNRAILRHEALAIAPKLGIKVMRKTLDKAVAWGSIAIVLHRNGPLSTAELRDKFDPQMDARQYATLRSHLFRMDLAGLISAVEKQWRLTNAELFSAQDQTLPSTVDNAFI